MKMRQMFRGSGRPDKYLTAAGERVPSVTTITGARKTGVEGLLVWANRLGQEGKSHKDEREKAADAGSRAHSMVENAIHGLDPLEGLPAVEPEIHEKAIKGFEAWESWSRVMHVDYLCTEQPMVSEEYLYGGTPDAIGVVNHQVALLDWKTSNAVYGDHIIQLAAYRHLWDERPAALPIETCYLLRFGKEMGDYHVHAYPLEVLDIGWQAFLSLRDLYDLDKKLKAVAK
jgi:hypothetical protein